MTWSFCSYCISIFPTYYYYYYFWLILMGQQTNWHPTEAGRNRNLFPRFKIVNIFLKVYDTGEISGTFRHALQYWYWWEASALTVYCCSLPIIRRSSINCTHLNENTHIWLTYMIDAICRNPCLMSWNLLNFRIQTILCCNVVGWVGYNLECSNSTFGLFSFSWFFFWLYVVCIHSFILF